LCSDSGTSPTLADLALHAYTHIAPEGGFDLSGIPGDRGLLERVAAMPRHIPIGA
jgi:glutathione S-transferase